MIELFTSSAPLFIGTVFVLSLLVGSFLNVVIHRVPIMMEREWKAQAIEILGASDAPASSSFASNIKPPTAPAKYNLMVPRSACPQCGAGITALQNIPVISYLVLGGRCSGCSAPISARYPLVEFGTAVLSALVAWKFGFTPFTAGALLLTWMLVAMTCIDIDHQVLPDNLTLPLMWAGLLASVTVTSSGALPVSPQDSLLGAAAGYLSLWLVYHLFKLATGKEGMGYGDFKLLAALGAWLGWKMLPLVILLSAVTGAFIGILMIALRGRDRNIPIPFGPYLAAAGWIALMWGPGLVEAYLNRLR